MAADHAAVHASADPSMTVPDIRDTPGYRAATAMFERMWQPGKGLICDAAELRLSPDGREIVFVGSIAEKLEGVPATRICFFDTAGGAVRIASAGPGSDQSPRYSPDGAQVAFLSDRATPGRPQLFLLERATGAIRAAPEVDGWVEYLHWSPDGQRLLLGLAGNGADVSGGQGAIASSRARSDVESWMPRVETGNEQFRWRSLCIYDLDAHTLNNVAADKRNFWEACWCGPDRIAAITSPGPSEGLWYSAQFELIDLASGSVRCLFAPAEQLGWPAASPSGRHAAVVEALCSDRWIVAGEVRLVSVADGKVISVDTNGVDIAHIEWRSEDVVLLSGHRGFEIVAGLYSLKTGRFDEIWASAEISAGGRYFQASGAGVEGTFAFVAEGFERAPELALVKAGEFQTIASFDIGYGEVSAAISQIEQLRWTAPDGLEIEGWLLRPHGPAPHPLVMIVHGGPVSHWRSRYLGRPGFVNGLFLAEQGYAVFYPNPRGSAGRGQDFARRVLGDIGGKDAQDCLSGLDHLVARGVADPSRLGISGGSYGGYMTSWLIGQDDRFAAAIPIAPVTNKVSQHLMSNIPQFIEMFLDDKYHRPGGRYHERSPIMHAWKVKTPTLNICGALDRCTPPAEAWQFHNALLEVGTRSVLIEYPEEGHGVRNLPAAIDCLARMADWFEHHMPARPAER